MKIICPNFKNEEVAKEFEELKNATSEAAAYHIWSQNNGNGIDKAPNGEPSKLFSDLLEHYNGDRVAAIQAKAKTYSKSFVDWFDGSKVIDSSGEPLIVYRGTRSDSQVHDSGTFRSEIIFTTPNKTGASRYGEPIPLFVSMKNPAITDYEGKEYDSKVEDPFYVKGQSFTAIDRKTKKAAELGHDGLIVLNVKDGTDYNIDEYNTLDSNNVKSIDNQGTFSTQNNNIYNQEVTVTETPTGRNAKLQEILQKVYPQINLSEFNDPNLRGKAIVRANFAGEVLINAATENQDTLPHEYAHHYISWFRNNPTVKAAIKAFGSEEKLVQKIGENSVKAIKWYNKIWNSIKGLFNKNQKMLNELTESFLAGENYKDPFDVIDELYYYQPITTSVIDETKKTIRAIDKVYIRLISDTHARIKDLMHYKVLDNKKIDQLNNLVNTLEKMESDQAVFYFITYMQPEIVTAHARINKLKDEVTNAKRGDRKINIDPEQLLQIKTSFIGYYSTAVNNINNMLDDYTVSDYLNDKEALEKLRGQMQNIKEQYSEIQRKYIYISGEVAKQAILDYATKAGSTSVEELRGKLDVTDVDISAFEQWAGSPIYAKDEVIRIMADKILNAKNKVSDITTMKGHEVVDVANKSKKKDLVYIREVDEKGRPTGFFVRPLNYGVHFQKLLAYRRELAAKFGLKDAYKRPTDKKELREYNKLLNNWHKEYSERRFIPEYYDLFNNLSDETLAARDKYQDEINYYLSKVTDKNGDVHKEEMSDEDFAAYEAAEKAKSNLANRYNLDGTLKDGIDKQIAIELTELNEKLSGNLKYSPNKEKFKKAYAKAEKLSKALFKKWLDRNTIIKIDEQFYKDLEKLSTPYEKSEDTLSLEGQRRELTRLYRQENGDVNTENMPDEVKRMIAELDEQISASRAYDKATQEVSSGNFESIAHLEIDPKYYEQFDKYSRIGGEEFDNWLKNNTYQVNGSIQPASFWTKFVPNDKKYYTRYPNKSWAEVDRDSFYYNKNFDESLGESVIPKKSKFDNSAAYKKMAKNTELFNLYNKLVSTMEEANSHMPFLQRANKYRLPQIEGGAWRLIRSQSNLLKGLKYLMSSAITVKDQDDEFNRQGARRSDGSVVNLVPTRFLKMLDNPAAITEDTVGSVIKYYEMAVNYSIMKDIAPELELMADKIGTRDYENEKKGIEQGTATRSYKKAQELLEKKLYGKAMQEIEIDAFGRKINISKVLGLLASYTRILGISQNPHVILTGLITNKIQNRLEALSGYYYDNATLNKASLEVARSYGSVLSGLGNADAKNKIVGLMEHAQVGRSVRETFDHLNMSAPLRTIYQHYWYFGHEMVDYATKGKMLVAVYMSHKYNPETKTFQYKNEFIRSFNGTKTEAKAAWNRLTTTLYDAYEMKNGVLVVKEAYKEAVTPTLENRVRNTARSIGTRIDGQLSDIDKSYIHGHSLLQFLTIFRNFMIVNWQTMFAANEQFNYSTGRYLRSYFGAAGKHIKTEILPKTWAWDLIKGLFNEEKIEDLKQLAYNYDDMKDFEKAAFKRVSYTVLISLLLAAIAVPLLNGAADDDRDNWFLNEAAYLAARATLETRGTIYPKDWFSLLNSPTAATSTLTSIYDGLGVWFDDPNAKIRKGPYRGMKRYERSLIKMTPFKLIQEAKDPRSKRDYLENQILAF